MARKRVGSWNSDQDLEHARAPSEALSHQRITPIDTSTGTNKSSPLSFSEKANTTTIRKRIAAWKRKLQCSRRSLARAVLAVLVLYVIFVQTWNLLHTAEPCRVARETAINLKHSMEEEASRNRNDALPPDWKPELPKIIHHQWKDEHIPEKYDAWHQRWLDLYPAPEYTHMLWTDESARQLVKEHYPWFLETYDDYNMPMKRADAARYFYLHQYGGLHTDLDYEPLSNAIFQHLPSDRVALVESPYKFSENTQNSLMSSPRGDPFWFHVFTLLVQHSDRPLLSATGPKLLDRAIVAATSITGKASSSRRAVHMLPCENFHRIPLGERNASPKVTNVAREILARLYPMKQCGRYHSQEEADDDACHFARHHNTAVYVADSTWWDLLWNM